MVEENGNEKASHWFGGGEDDEKEVDDGYGQNQRTVERKEEGNQEPGDGVDNVGKLKPDNWDGESAAFGDAAMSWHGAKHVEERRGEPQQSRHDNTDMGLVEHCTLLWQLACLEKKHWDSEMPCHELNTRHEELKTLDVTVLSPSL